MGSTNTGRFTDYPGPQAGQQPRGGGDDASRCARPIEHEVLDEVERCEYFVAHQGVPPLGTDVQLRRTLQGGRLAVATLAGDEVIGYLPTSRNYLRACMEEGWTYSGEVVAAITQRIATIRVELRASR